MPSRGNFPAADFIPTSLQDGPLENLKENWGPKDLGGYDILPADRTTV